MLLNQKRKRKTIRMMLPDFPSLKAEIQRIAFARLRDRVDTGDPVFSKVKRFIQHEGREMQYEQYGGGSVREGGEEIGIKVEIKITDVPALVGEKFDAKLEEMAQGLISQSAKALFKKVSETCEKAGTSIDAGGKPPSPEIFFEMMSSVEMEFGPDGKPIGSIVVHPNMLPAVEKVAEQIENDPELKRRHAEILERQREAWTARENNRKLAD